MQIRVVLTRVPHGSSEQVTVSPVERLDAIVSTRRSHLSVELWYSFTMYGITLNLSSLFSRNCSNYIPQQNYSVTTTFAFCREFVQVL